MLDLQNANTLLINYEKLMVKTMAECDVVHRDFTKRSWTGDYVEFPLNIRKSDAVGGGTDGSEYRAGSHRSHLKGVITRAYVDATVELSEGIMEASDGPNASVNALEDELSGIVESMDCFQNSTAFGDGDGVIGRLAATPGSDSIVVAMDGGLFLPQLLNWPGARIEIRDVNTPATVHGTATIDAVGTSTTAGDRVGLASSGEIVLQLDADLSSSGAAAGDLIVWRGGDKSSYGLLPEGFNSLVDNIDESFQNIDIGAHPQYSSYVDQTGGTLRKPDIDMVRRALTNVRLKTGTKAMNYALYGNPATHAVWDEEGEALLRYDPSSSTLGRAISGVQTNQGGVTFEQVNACPDTHFFGLDKNQLVCYEQRPLQFVRRGGEILTPSHTRKKYFAHMTGIWQNAIMARHTSFKITDLDSSDYRAVSFS